MKLESIPASASYPGIDPGRIRWIAENLVPGPFAAGAPFSDRKAWQAFGEADPDLLGRATQLLDEQIPELTDESYLLYSKVGVRADYEAIYRQRLLRLATFAMAECVGARGQYLAAFEAQMASILDEKTWVMSAHDGNLDNFEGRAVRIDLGAAMRGAAIATAVLWLKDHLAADLQARVLGELRRRLFEPYLEAIRDPENQTTCRWLRGTSNWNAVCHSGVVIAALAALPSPDERALILAGAEKYLAFYRSGFTADGYCSEGLGYWNYGFGHYVTMAEWVLRATSGRMNFYADPAVFGIASYPFHLEMAPGVYPSVADCELYTRPAEWIQSICDERLFSGGMPGRRQRECHPAHVPMLVYQSAVSGFPLFELPPEDARSGGRKPDPDALRGWFGDAGILVARPGGTDCDGKISVLLKGGHNNEHHNHNDLGTFVVALNGRQPVIDPGSAPYTRDTFSPKRYESETMNSIGHAVPVVAGALQSTGAGACAVVLDRDFSPEADMLKLDLSSAYEVPSLQRLERTFVYDRSGNGRLTVTDHFEFSRPESFESAFISMGAIEAIGAGIWMLRDEAATLLVTVNTGGAAFEVLVRPIVTVVVPAPCRLSIRLKQPAQTGFLTWTLQPG